PRTGSSSVGTAVGLAPDGEPPSVPGRNCGAGHAECRSCTSPFRLDLTATANAPRTLAGDSQARRISPSHRIRCAWPCWRVSAAFRMPSLDPSQPHNVGDTNNCARHRRRLRYSCLSPRPHLAPIARAVSLRITCRYSVSTMTVAAYHRHGCSQSGNRLMVWPHLRHRSEEHTSELQSRGHLVCRLLLEKKKHNRISQIQDL